MSDPSLQALGRRLAGAPVIAAVPLPIDLSQTLPVNPPQGLQEKFVGLSFDDAYQEATSFVSGVMDRLSVHGLDTLDASTRIVDFGSGWGRISRMLLHYVPPTSLYALDVDPEMTALVNSTMPGLNALTVSTLPPTVLGTAAFDGVVSFSVFSHLSEESHTAWADEFGRLVRPGGFAAITVLDHSLFASVRSAQREVAGASPSPFAVNMASTFPDIKAAARAYKRGVFQFAPVADDGARDGEHYGWAAAPVQFLERTWGAAGFRVLEMVRAGVLFPQALVVMKREATSVDGAQARAFRSGRRWWAAAR